MSNTISNNNNNDVTTWQSGVSNAAQPQDGISQSKGVPAAGALTAGSSVEKGGGANYTPAVADTTQTNNADGSPALSPPGANLDPDTMVVLLSSLRNKTIAATMQTISKTMQSLKTALKDKLAEKLKLLDEQFEQQRKALAQQKCGAIGGFLGKIFGAIAMVFTAVALTIATVATAGAASPLLVAGLTLTVALTAYAIADAGIAAANMQLMKEGKEPIPGMDQLLGKGLGAVLEGLGVDKDTADQVGGYLAMGLTLGLSIAAVVMTFGASAPSSLTTVMRAIQIGKTIAAIGKGAGQITEGASTVETGKIQAALADVRATIQEKDAASGSIQKMLDDVQKQIDDLVKAIQEFYERSAEILSGQDSSARQRIGNIRSTV